MKARSNILIVLLLVMLSGAVLNAAKPLTIPALREWTDGSGHFVFSAASRIVIEGTYDSQLAIVGAIFANDLLQLTALTIPVINAAGADAGDIYLSLSSSDSQLSAEGYSLSITDRITINAKSDAGVFYGTRTVLQLLKQGFSIASGSARDWPSYPERALMVDIGRKYFTISWLKKQIIDMSYLKMNVLHLHLTDNLGFRLRSAVHPEITSDLHYTRAEIDSLHELAGKFHVMLIPEIDMPSHTAPIARNHPELTCGGPINLCIDTTYRFFRSIIEEFIPWFPAPYWHVGADEYTVSYANQQCPGIFPAYAQAHYGPTANNQDVFLGFVNWVDSIVKGHGKTLRAWSDGLSGGSAVKVNTDITYDMWSCDGISAKQAVNEGRTVINSNSGYLYYNLGSGAFRNQRLYELFEPNLLPCNAIAVNDPHNRGAELCVWCDNPNAETENQIAAGIYNPLRILAQKDWGTTLLTAEYSQFEPIILAVGSAPGLVDDNTGTIVSSSGGSKENEFSIYPTAANAGSFCAKFDLKRANNVKLDVYNILGQRVCGTNFTNVRSGIKTVALGHPASGVYLCRMNFDNRMETIKFVVK